MAISDFVPKYIQQTLADNPQQVVTATRWNELWNLIIEQGDHNSEYVNLLCEENALIYDAMEDLNAAIQEAVLGEIPDGTITAAKLNFTPVTSTTFSAHATDATKHLDVMTTQGDLVYQGASAPARLAKGTARQVLAMNSSATAPEWVASLQSLLTAQGDIPYASAANTPARLAKGTALQQLLMNSGATAPEWAASLQSLMTAQGDLVYASGANTPARLAKGTASQVLAMNGGATAPEWVTQGPCMTYGGNTLASAPTERSYTGQSSALKKKFTIKEPGWYQINGEFKSSQAGQTIQVYIAYDFALRVLDQAYAIDHYLWLNGWAGASGLSAPYYTIAQSSSQFYANFSLYTPYLLPGASISIYLGSTGNNNYTAYCRNVTLVAQPYTTATAVVTD